MEDDKFEEDVEKFSVSLTTADSFIYIMSYRGDVEIRDNESKGREKCEV